MTPDAITAVPDAPTSSQPVPQPGQQPGQQRIRLDTATLKSTYCNVCNATSTREEVVLSFGVNKTWDLATTEMEVQMEHRVILSPHATKRLHELLTQLLADHEQRFGTLR